MKPFQSLAEVWASGLVDRAQVELLIDVVESEKAAERAWPAVEEVLRLGPESWPELVGEVIPVTWGTAATAARRGFEAAHTSGRRAAFYGHVGWSVTQALTDLYVSHAGWRSELTAYVHAATGNGLRVAGLPEMAGSAFNFAFEALGPIDQPSWLPFRTEVLSSAAKLMLDFGSFQAGLDLISYAEAAAVHVLSRSRASLAQRLALQRAGALDETRARVLPLERPLDRLRLDRDAKGALRLAWDVAREEELEPVGLEMLMEQLERVHRRYGR